MRLSERSDLPFIGAREGGERLRRELKGTRETKRTDSSRRVQRSYSISTTEKLFSFRVTFRIPVVRGKNLDIGLAHSRNPRHVVTRRGEAKPRRPRRGTPGPRLWVAARGPPRLS